MEPPISVGSDHVESFHEGKLTLKTIKSAKLVLDEYQPSCLFMKLDEKFFHPHLVFSNTVRSLINVQGPAMEKLQPIKSSSKNEDDEGEREEATQLEGNNVTMAENISRIFSYEVADFILLV